MTKTIEETRCKIRHWNQGTTIEPSKRHMTGWETHDRPKRLYAHDWCIINPSPFSAPISPDFLHGIDGDSQLGTTRVVSGVRILMYRAGSSQTASPREIKAEMRPSVDLTNEAQHVGVQKVGLESEEEKSAVDRPEWVKAAREKFVWTLNNS